MTSLGAALFGAIPWILAGAAGLIHPPAGEIWAEAGALAREREGLLARALARRRAVAALTAELRSLLAASKPEAAGGLLGNLRRLQASRRLLRRVLALRERLLAEARARAAQEATRRAWAERWRAHRAKLRWLGLPPLLPPLPPDREAEAVLAARRRERERTARVLLLLEEEEALQWEALARRVAPPPPLPPPPRAGPRRTLWEALRRDRERWAACRRRYRARLARLRENLAQGHASPALWAQAEAALSRLLAEAGRLQTTLQTGRRRLVAGEQPPLPAPRLPHLPLPARWAAAAGLLLVGFLGGRFGRALAAAGTLALLALAYRAGEGPPAWAPPAAALALLLGWLPWDLAAGLFLRLRSGFRPGVRLEVQGEPRRLVRLGLRGAVLSGPTARGAREEAFTPYHRLLRARLRPLPPPIRFRLHPGSDPEAVARLARAVCTRRAGAEGRVEVRSGAQALHLEVFLPDGADPDRIGAALRAALDAAPFAHRLF